MSFATFLRKELSAAFVKVFTDYQINKSEKEAWQLASLVLNALAVVLSVDLHYRYHFLAAVRRPDRRRIFAGKGGTGDNADADNVPVHLLVAMAAVAMGVLNTKGVFGIPASASTVFNIVSIVFGLASPIGFQRRRVGNVGR